ncbi:MAG TPA: cardiolipin synthase ClsB [Burkholderiaceae bacterium]|nr:cardiolipin synthase ClsB [Burkholderiaceae bacterium]
MQRKPPRIVWRDGNRITLLRGGSEFFPALCRAIDQAQRSVHIETYLFRLDRTGLRVLEHLRDACSRGVKVRVVLDGYGSAADAGAIVQAIERVGGQCRVYRPEPSGWRSFRLSHRRLRRMHRKLAVIDRREAFVGGINIVDDLDGASDTALSPRFDFAVAVQGPLAFDVAAAQNRLWLRFAWRRPGDWKGFYERLGHWFARVGRDHGKHAPNFTPGVRAALLLRDNLRNRQAIENVYLDAMDQAHDEILVANAYFFPGRRLRHALEQAARRGVRVRLLLQGLAEYPLAFRASRSMYRNMLDEGIEIHEYVAGYLHAKVAVIDGQSMVGSSNMDPFSLLLAREANVFINDSAFTHGLEADLEAALRERARQVTRQSLMRRSVVGRLIDDASYLLLRLGVVLTGRSGEF